MRTAWGFQFLSTLMGLDMAVGPGCRGRGAGPMAEWRVRAPVDRRPLAEKCLVKEARNDMCLLLMKDDDRPGVDTYKDS